MHTPSPAPKLDQIFPGPLPGPVIAQEPLTPRMAPQLPPILQEAYRMATQEGVKVKLIVCRLPGVPAREDGSHEVRMIVPQSRVVQIAGTTI